MTDKELLYVKVTAEEKNVTRAAEKLHIAQPSLTQSIQRIEKSLDCALFNRTASGLILTEAGQLYYDMACRILHEWDAFSDQLSQLSQLKSGHLVVGASWYNTLLVLTGALSLYHEQYPQIDVRLAEHNTAELERLLSIGKLDLILLHQYPAEYAGGSGTDQKKLDYIPLFQDDFCVVAHKKFNLSAFARDLPEYPFPVLDPAVLEDTPFVMFSENQRIRHITDFVLQQAGITPKASLSTYGFPSALELVRNGMGVTFLPELYLKHLESPKDPIQIFSIDRQYSAYWTTTACCYHSDYLPFTTKAFLDLLREISSLKHNA